MRHALVTTLAALALLGVPAATAAAPVFHEDFESGGAGWTCYAGPMTVVPASGPDLPNAHLYEREAAGGDCFSPAFFIPAGTHCVSTWIWWESGGWPFLDVAYVGDWEIGMEGYNPTITPVFAGDEGWNWYAHEFVSPGVASYIATEMWNGASKPGPTSGYFDGIDVSPGACGLAPTPPVPELGTLALALAGLAAIAGIVVARRR